MRRRRPSLRGSVQQNAPVRLRARETTRFGILMRFSALTGSLVLLGGIAIWLWHIGWPQKQVEHLVDAGLHATQRAHFAVGDVQVEGRSQTSKESLFNALGISSGSPILGFDPVAAQARIVKLPWVAGATVERRLPDTIIVRLTERAPLARWQHDNRTVVVDNEGKELPNAALGDFANLPLVVGVGAPAQAKTLLDDLKAVPAVQQRMTAAVRVSERRWDLHLEPKVTVRMPEADLAGGLKRLSDLIEIEKILDRGVSAIDLRLPDRVIFEPDSNNSTATRPAKDQHL